MAENFIPGTSIPRGNAGIRTEADLLTSTRSNPNIITPSLDERNEAKRAELRSRPVKSFINPETNEIVLGQPKEFDVYAFMRGDNAKGIRLNSSNIAELLVENLHELPTGSYQRLLDSGLTPDQLIQDLALDPQTQNIYTMPTGPEAVMQGAGKGVRNLAAMAVPMAAVGTATGNPYVVGGAGLLGLLGYNITESALFPSEKVVPGKRNLEMSGEFFSSMAASSPAALLIPENAIAKNLPRLLGKNIRKLPIFKQVGRVLDFSGDVVERGLRSQRANPARALIGETGSGAGGAAAGAIYDQEAIDPSLERAALEVTGAFAFNPLNLLNMLDITDSIKQFRQLRSTEGRKQALADRIFNLFDEVDGEGGTQRLLDSLGPQSEYEKLLSQYNVNPGNPTAVERSRNPVLALLQNEQAKLDPNLGERVVGRYKQNIKAMENLMAGLIELDTPEALGAFGQAREAYFEGMLQADVGRAYERFEKAADRLTRAGTSFDENRLLSTFLDENLQAVRNQEKYLYDQVPKEISSDASFLLDAATELQKSTQVGSQSVRLDSGQNPISIRVALNDFKEILKGDDALEKTFDEVAEEVEANLPGLLTGRFLNAPDGPSKPEATGTRLPLPETITSGQLLKLRETVVGALARERRTGNSNSIVAQSLSVLENAIRKDLGALPKDTDRTVQRSLDNAIAFSEQVNDTYSRTLLGDIIKSNKAPEYLIEDILNRKPTAAIVALDQADTAINFLKDKLVEGSSGLPENIRNQIINGNLTPPPFANAQILQFYDDVNSISSRSATLYGQAERGMRDIFRRFTVFDNQGQLKPDRAAIRNFLADPENQNLITQISPRVLIDGELKSPLLEDLMDVDKAVQLFQNQGTMATDAAETRQKEQLISRFAGVTDNPGNVISRMIGIPGQRPDNPIQDFNLLAKDVANITQKDLDFFNLVDSNGLAYTPEDMKKALFDATVNRGFTESGGGTSDGEFSFARFSDYLTSPLVPGTSNRLDGAVPARGTGPITSTQNSVLDILRKNKIIDNEGFVNFKTVLNEAIEIESLLNSGDVEQILKAYETNPITAELVQRLIGAKLGTIAGDLLPGTSPNSLVAAGAGVRAVRGFLDKVPATMFQELGSSFFTDMDLTKEILQLGINRASGPSTPFLVDTAQSFANIGKNIGAEKALNVLRSSLISLGYTGLPSTEEIMQETFGATVYTPPGQRPSPGNIAGFRREQLRNQAAEQARVQGPVPPPMAMTDQAQQFLPQGPSSAPTAPNPQARAQFAAMFPDDITSNLIKADQQGIMSLNI